MNITRINEIINSTIDWEIIDSLSNVDYLKRMSEAGSTIKKRTLFEKIIKQISHTLQNNENDDLLSKDWNCFFDKLFINNEFLEKFIFETGAKGVVRGNIFNNKIRDIINSLSLDESCFEIGFEKKCNIAHTDEIPDWFIRNKKTNRLLIGMNQLDLWGGGHQLNRGFKYINYKNSEKVKLISVVCLHTTVKNENTKVYDLLNQGFTRDVICYPKKLKESILTFFGL